MTVFCRFHREVKMTTCTGEKDEGAPAKPALLRRLPGSLSRRGIGQVLKAGRRARLLTGCVDGGLSLMSSRSIFNIPLLLCMDGEQFVLQQAFSTTEEEPALT